MASTEERREGKRKQAYAGDLPGSHERKGNVSGTLAYGRTGRNGIPFHSACLFLKLVSLGPRQVEQEARGVGEGRKAQIQGDVNLC